MRMVLSSQQGTELTGGRRAVRNVCVALPHAVGRSLARILPTAKRGSSVREEGDSSDDKDA